MPAGVYELDHVASSNGEGMWWVSDDMMSHATILPVGQKMTSKDVLEIAQLDWEVEKVPAYDLWQGQFVEVPRDFHIRRADTGLVLGRGIGKRYEPYQNRTAVQFLDDVVDMSDNFFSTAGSLFNCQRIWVQMESPDHIQLGGHVREKIIPYLLFTNTHDGSGAVIVASVYVRVVCANTLAWGLSSAPRTYKVRHTFTMNDRLADARKSLDLSFKYREAFVETAEKMIEFDLSDEAIASFMDTLVPTKDAKGEPKKSRALTEATNTRNTIFSIFTGAENLQHLPEKSAYRFVQAVEEYSDHNSIFRNTETSSAGDNRFEKLSEGKTLGNKAFQLVSAAMA